MKKILILTVTAGNGHNACSYGMRDKLLKYPDVEVKVVDILQAYSTKLNIWTVDDGYNLAVARFPHLYNFFYEKYKKAKPQKRYKCSAQGITLSIVEGLYREIWEYQPDVVYATHYYGTAALTDLKLACKLPPKTIGANLDYVNSPFWETGIGVDYFSIPNQDFVEEFVAEGFSREQLVTTGLPVREDFFNAPSQKEAREKLGLSQDKFTVLTMFGGGHWSGGQKIFNWVVESADFPVQIIKINGKDKKSYKKVQKRLQKGDFPQNVEILNVGYTKNVATYMAAADLAINKYGGTSVTEAINCGTPMITSKHLAAQEEHNRLYMEAKGATKSFGNKKELSDLLHLFYSHPEELEKVRNEALKLRVNGVENLAELILNQPNAVYDEKDKLPVRGLKKNVKKAMSQNYKANCKQASGKSIN